MRESNNQGLYVLLIYLLISSRRLTLQDIQKGGHENLKIQSLIPTS